MFSKAGPAKEKEGSRELTKSRESACQCRSIVSCGSFAQARRVNFETTSGCDFQYLGDTGNKVLNIDPLVYHCHIDAGFRRGTSSRTMPADTILFNRILRFSSCDCSKVLPGRSITFSRESGCTRMPNFPRPRGSRRLSCFGPLVTHASAEQTHVLANCQVFQRRDRERCTHIQPVSKGPSSCTR